MCSWAVVIIAFQRHISKLILFQLLADTAPEPTEGVQISISTQDSPAFDSTDIMLFTRTLNFDIITTIIHLESTSTAILNGKIID